jgi:hypothetical protein
MPPKCSFQLYNPTTLQVMVSVDLEIFAVNSFYVMPLTAITANLTPIRRFTTIFIRQTLRLIQFFSGSVPKYWSPITVKHLPSLFLAGQFSNEPLRGPRVSRILIGNALSRSAVRSPRFRPPRQISSKHRPADATEQTERSSAAD